MTDLSFWNYQSNWGKMMSMENALANRIKDRLEAVNKSAAAASLEAGLGRSAITDILSGNSGSPRLSTLEKLTSVLDCSISYLVGAGDAEPTDVAEDDSAPRRVRPASNRMSAGAIAKLGTYLTESAHSESLDELYYQASTRVFGSPDFPGWAIDAVLIGDNSLLPLGFQKFDIATIALHPIKRRKDSIPLRHRSMVCAKHHLPFDGLSEISIRIVERANGRINLLSRHDFKYEASASARDCLSIALDTVTDAPEGGNNNIYDVANGSVEIIGIVIRNQREIFTGE